MGCPQTGKCWNHVDTICIPTGFPKGAMIHQHDGNVKDGLLTKPYRREELEEALIAALDATA